MLQLGNQALREAFRIFDKDKSGYIEAREIALTAQALGEALSEAELREFMAEADLDGDGRLNYNGSPHLLAKMDLAKAWIRTRLP